MSKSEQFREYAKEALDWALRAKTEKEREMLIYLAQTWTLAATWNDRTYCPPPGFGKSVISLTCSKRGSQPNEADL
jgi:hypothetical protein